MLHQYALKFTGKISWEGQANGLPPEIYAYLIVEGEGNAQEKAFIDQTIENQAAMFTRIQAMIVQRRQGDMIDLRQTPADRILVPMRWIVQISASVHALGAELTMADEKGVERLSNGEKPKLQ